MASFGLNKFFRCLKNFLLLRGWNDTWYIKCTKYKWNDIEFKVDVKIKDVTTTD